MFRSVITRLLRNQAVGVALRKRRSVETSSVPRVIEHWESQLNEAERQHLLQIRAEYEILKYTDGTVPEMLTDEQWQQLFNFRTIAGRKRYFEHLFHWEQRRQEKQQLKEAKLAAAPEKELLKQAYKEGRRNCDHIVYGLGGNSIFTVLNETTTSLAYKHRVATAIRINSPRLVFDFSFLAKSNVVEIRLTLQHIRSAIMCNRNHPQPFQLHFTGVDRNSDYWHILTTNFLTEFERNYDYFITYTTRSYLEVFPRDRLVVLSSDSHKMMEKFNSDKIYIVGAMLDSYKKFSIMSAAKEANLPCFRLPITKYVRLTVGAKTDLTVNWVTRILLDANMNGDWTKAIGNNLPTSYLRDPTEAFSRTEQFKLQRGNLTN